MNVWLEMWQVHPILTLIAALIIICCVYCFFANLFPFLLPNLYAQAVTRKVDARLRAVKRIQALCEESPLSPDDTAAVIQAIVKEIFGITKQQERVEQ